MKKVILIVIFATTFVSNVIAEWKPVEGRIMTKWASEVDPKNPLPEYPRPQLVRENWTNLNGLWDYAITSKDAGQPDTFEGEILVPYPIESALSGVKRKFTPNDRLWYSRSFNPPAVKGGERLMLNFGAIDYKSEVFVNGTSVGKHTGGYDAFSYDITKQLKKGANTLVVSVTDSTNGARGKQQVIKFDQPGRIHYTANSGIWQTVWMEKVAETHISDLKIVPNIDNGTVSVTVNAKGGTASVTALDEGKKIATAKGKAGETIILNIPSAKLWSPDSPFLYDLKISLGKDTVTSYFGMRKISIEKDEKGKMRPKLNNEFIFMTGPLDQGYWPDGNLTAPTDEALKFDLEMTKKYGFNSTRKHVKIEPARWFYWTDKLGLLVWQDMPNGGAGTGAKGNNDGVPKSKEQADQFEKELRLMVDQHSNYPSVIMWVIFNESWGQYDTPRLTKMVKDMDPTRLVCGGSGWYIPPACGDVFDRHVYKRAPSVAPDATRIGVGGEFGGFGYVAVGNLWVADQRESSVYGTAVDKRHFEKMYLEAWEETFANDLRVGMSGAIYTQLTDVETEINGLMSYDRKVMKIDPELARKAIEDRNFPKKASARMLVPTSEKEPQEYYYTMTKPSDDWFKPNADRSSWSKGPGVIGNKVHRNPTINIGTEWKSSDLWVARNFDLSEFPLKRPVIRVAYDENATIYINGVKALSLKKGDNTRHLNIPMPAEAAAALKKTGNVIAIHVDNKNKSQYIDVGIGEESITW